MKHETKEEWFKRSSLITKIAYLTGALKLIHKKYTFKNEFRFGVSFRRVHPLGWLAIIIGLLGFGFNKDTLKQLKNDSVWW